MSRTQAEYEGNFPTLRRAPGGLRRAVRWLWRKTWRYSLGLLVLLIIAHIVLNVIAGRRLEAELQKLRAAGQPLTPVEAAPPPVPDEQNAAALYLYVFRGETGPIDPKRLLDPKKWAGWGKSFPGADDAVLGAFASGRDAVNEHGATIAPPTLAEAKAVLARHERQFELIRQASLMPYCRFPVNWEAGFGAIFPHLAGLRATTRFLVAKARADAASGDTAAAFDDLTTAVRAIEQISDSRRVIDELMRVACVDRIADTLPDILAAAPPDEQQARAFYDLLERVGSRESLTKAMEGERRVGLWAFDYVRREGPFALFGLDGEDREQWPASKRFMERSWPLQRIVVEPLIKLDQVYYLQYTQKQIDLTRKPYSESRAAYARLRWESSNSSDGRPWYGVVSATLMPMFAHTVAAKSDEGRAKVELMRAAMALRVYQIRHGRYPASLAELGAVGWPIATDPFSGEGFVYRREGKGYVLYSLGPDGKDQRGMSYVEWKERRTESGDALEYDIPLRTVR